MKLTPGKRKGLEIISNEDKVVIATAMDQRGSLGKMIQSHNEDLSYEEGISDFKVGVSEIIGNQSSSFLLDPEYGWDAAKKLNEDVGLIMAYEKTGYDANEKGRLPNLVDFYAVQDLARKGVSAIKLLVYYDIEEEAQYNDIKKTLIKRVGDECKYNDILFIFEPVSYNSQSDTSKDTDFIRRKPEIVKYFMKEFSKLEYGIDLLKVEVPVPLHNIEGFSNYENYNPAFSVEEASALYLECSELTAIPFIYLSGGVSNDQFVETLQFAKNAGAKFNGCLCGRAIWKEVVKTYAKDGADAQYQWLNDTGIENLKKVRKAIDESATPWTHYID